MLALTALASLFRLVVLRHSRRNQPYKSFGIPNSRTNYGQNENVSHLRTKRNKCFRTIVIFTNRYHCYFHAYFVHYQVLPPLVTRQAAISETRYRNASYERATRADVVIFLYNFIFYVNDLCTV